jgi:hypothetical protein
MVARALVAQEGLSSVAGWPQIVGSVVNSSSEMVISIRYSIIETQVSGPYWI